MSIHIFSTTALEVLLADASVRTNDGLIGDYVPNTAVTSTPTTFGYGLPADVFSYGILAWEIFSDCPQKNPLKGLDLATTVTKV